MSSIEFFDEIQSQSYVEYDETPKIVSLVIRYSRGLIKDEKQANFFLLGFVILAISLSILLFGMFGLNKSKQEPVKEMVLQEFKIYL